MQYWSTDALWLVENQWILGVGCLAKPGDGDLPGRQRDPVDLVAVATHAELLAAIQRVVFRLIVGPHSNAENPGYAWHKQLSVNSGVDQLIDRATVGTLLDRDNAEMVQPRVAEGLTDRERSELIKLGVLLNGVARRVERIGGIGHRLDRGL